MIFQARTEQVGSGRTSSAKTPIQWVGLVMDFTVGTGIVLWHFLVATANTHAPRESARGALANDRSLGRAS